MKIIDELLARSNSKCELCAAEESLSVYEVPLDSNSSADKSVLICEACREQVEVPEKIDVNHWRCLKDSMWAQIPAVRHGLAFVVASEFRRLVTGPAGYALSG